MIMRGIICFRLIGLVLSLLATNSLKSQSNPYACIDTTRIVYNPACYTEFEPMCGCDGVTYRNYCFLQAAGVNLYDGAICESIALDIYPNPVINYLYVTLILKVQGDAPWFIFDQMGNLVLNGKAYQTNRYNTTLDVSWLPRGFYFMLSYGPDEVVYQKFIKTN